ncbi:MAG TPA: DUF1844 domain-containing protein [Jatrophihabitans sp.]
MTSQLPNPDSRLTGHPGDAIPLPDHGFATIDDLDGPSARELAEIPAIEVITKCAVMLMSSAAEKLGLAPDGDVYIDLDESRRLIAALAGLLSASKDTLGIHRQPLMDGLKTLQTAFRETSVIPDEPGEGPGEGLVP